MTTTRQLKENYYGVRQTIAELKATMPPMVKAVWRAGEAYGRLRGVRHGWQLGYSLGRFHRAYGMASKERTHR